MRGIFYVPEVLMLCSEYVAHSLYLRFRLAQKMKKIYSLFAFTLFTLPLVAQVQVESSSFSIYKSEDFKPKEVQPGFNANIYSLEAPDAMSWRGHLNEIKREAARLYPSVESDQNPTYKTTPTPLMGWSSPMYKYLSAIGSTVVLNGGIPNDNTLALNKSGILLSAVNTFIWAYDLNNDTLHTPNSIIDLDIIGPDASNDHGFDPKLMYDDQADRFILVFLKNNKASNSKITVCFSSTNDPNDPWYTYILPGNPLNNNRWTDFPSISITEDHLLITGNLIIPDVSWQVGFDGSVIWQLDKNAGFAGDTAMPNRLYHDIRFGSNYIRNLHPVKGYKGEISTPYFLSNRNFDIQNDSIFVLSLHSDITGPEDLRIGVVQSDLAYGVPPNGRQQDTDPNDPTDGLQTNDGRVLAAIQLNDGTIHFASNTRNFTTGRSAIYHGILTQLESTPQIHATLIADPILDFGYPNIAWAGNEDCDQELIIGFNHTGISHYAGVSAIYYSNEGNYSEVLRIKTGEGIVNRLPGGDRWGDYFGIQNDFAHPGKVYVSGYFGTSTNKNATFLAELTSPDSAKIGVQFELTANVSRCDQEVEAIVSGGTAPYTYTWNGTSGASMTTACGNDTLHLLISDARGCESSFQYIVPFNLPNRSMTYPNPTAGFIGVVFEAPASGEVIVQLSDLTGRSVWTVTRQSINGGKNYLEFDLTPVKNGMYILDIIQNDESIYTEKIIKNQ